MESKSVNGIVMRQIYSLSYISIDSNVCETLEYSVNV